MEGDQETDVFIRRLVAIGKFVTIVASSITSLIVTVVMAFK